MLDKNYLVDFIRKKIIQETYSDEIYNDYKVIVTKEEQFINEDIDYSNHIFIVVKFEEGTMFNEHQSILPFTLRVLAEKNSAEICEKLMTTFAEKNHLTFNEDFTIKQYYATPSITSNFNEVFEGFRNLIYLSGTFLIGKNSIRVTVTDLDSGKELETLESLFDYTPQLDTQVTFSSNNFSQSVGKVATRTLAFSMNASSTPIIEKALKIYCEQLSIDTEFNFDLKFQGGLELKNTKWKLAGLHFVQNISNFPTIALSFTN